MLKIHNLRRSHNATSTQIESWEKFRDSNSHKSQQIQVLEYLSGQEGNSRTISNTLNIERTAVLRVLNDLYRKDKIIITREARCTITGRRTQFYTQGVNPEASDGNTLQNAPKCVQGELFNQIAALFNPVNPAIHV